MKLKVFIFSICIFFITSSVFSQSEKIKLHDVDSIVLNLGLILAWSNPESDTLRDKELFNKCLNQLKTNIKYSNDSVVIIKSQVAFKLAPILWSVYEDKVKGNLHSGQILTVVDGHDVVNVPVYYAYKKIQVGILKNNDKVTVLSEDGVYYLIRSEAKNLKGFVLKKFVVIKKI